MRKTTLIVLLSTGAPVAVLAQSSDPFTEQSLIRWALTQGGLTVLLIVILFFYRRDLSRIDAAQKEHAETLTGLVERTAQAIERMDMLIEGLITEVRRGLERRR